MRIALSFSGVPLLRFLYCLLCFVGSRSPLSIFLYSFFVYVYGCLNVYLSLIRNSIVFNRIYHAIMGLNGSIVDTDFVLVDID